MRSTKSYPAVLRGRTEILPWRVGILIDAGDQSAVEEALRLLGRAWGGVYMPILDTRQSIDAVRAAAGRFDVDSLYCDEPPPHLGELIHEDGYRWTGRGEWGPFAYGGSLSREVLRWEQIAAPRRPYLGSVPTSALLWHAVAGIPDQESGPIDLVATASVLLRPRGRSFNPAGLGVMVVAKDDPTSVMNFWNLRAAGVTLEPLIAESDSLLEPLLRLERAARDSFRQPQGRIAVWGTCGLGSSQRDQLDEFESNSDVMVDRFEMPFDAEATEVHFVGLDSDLRQDFRVEVDRESRVVDVPLAKVPLRERSEIYMGRIRAHVQVHQATNFDPRLTAAVPPFRRHAALLASPFQPEVNDQRADTEGVGFSVDATRDLVGYPLVRSVDVMALLFRDPDVRVQQSDAGLFESRTAELFGAPTDGALTQPGLRAAIMKTASTFGGLPAPAIEAVIRDNRGAWPDQFYRHREDPPTYVKNLAKALANSGFLVPMLRAKCPRCGVWDARDVGGLGATYICEFCGGDVNLGLAIAAQNTRWHFRAASHLPENSVRGMLPAAASLSVLHNLLRVEGPPECHVLGLAVKLPGRDAVEIDVAAVLHNRDWVTVVGEVKSHGMIDHDKIEKIEAVRSALELAGVPTLAMFAVDKEAFNPDEQALLRAYVERSGLRSPTRSSQMVPRVPLLLVHNDLSVPQMNDEHPWRWGSDYHFGVFGTALASLNRNLGLVDWQITSVDGEWSVDYTWDPIGERP